jgi:DNA repair photolyase
MVDEYQKLPVGTDAILSLACGCGVQTLGDVYDPLPVIPALNDTSIEESLAAAAQAGATMAGYQMLRLPNELKTLFREWLATHVPQRAAHVMSLVQQLRNGRDNDPRFGTRMTGTGNYADLIAKRFELACRRNGLNGDERGQAPRRDLDCSRFRRPDPAGQMALF